MVISFTVYLFGTDATRIVSFKFDFKKNNTKQNTKQVDTIIIKRS